jgi:hypothetical protein
MLMEILESRRHFSVVHPAAKGSKEIPDIIGVFTGHAFETKPLSATIDITLHITGESSKGVLSGTATQGGLTGIDTLTGKISNKGNVSLKILSGKKVIIAAKGSFLFLNDSIGGKYTTKGAKGTFGVSAED